MHDDELTAAIREVRLRARARNPETSLGLNGLSVPDLMPIVHARDAAEAKVAAIGTVNPRPGGLKNSIVQSFKKLIARALAWHVREQVEFNRGVIGCVQTTLDALAETNRSLAALAAHQNKSREEALTQIQQIREDVLFHLNQLREEMAVLLNEARELKDIRTHWPQWRTGFEQDRTHHEIRMLRTISELQAAFTHRVTLLEQNMRELARQQHTDFEGALDRYSVDIQRRLWRDLEYIRAEYQKVIHGELKIVRQKAVAQRALDEAMPGPSVPKTIAVDWLRFADNFRGPEADIRKHQQRYIDRFKGAASVLDLGCGRGEFLDAARDAGIEARGIDQSEECVGVCLSKGLKAERAELFSYLENLPDLSLGGVYCSQVVEHLPPDRLPDLVNLLAKKLNHGALLAVETPNPECLAIYATHFYLDPTHTRPVPARLLGFYLEEAGFTNLEVEWLSPAVESMPALGELPEAVRRQFFGALDYAIFSRKGNPPYAVFKES
ncbi:MAG TPA: class I SAM-dependent methyltransferase [Bryobacteraceae bacterium]|nr:class I SAM-dependent methyltransferase [Bryobacteraceae bacterium]